MNILYTMIGLAFGYIIFTHQRRWERKFECYIQLTRAISQLIFISDEIIRKRSDKATLTDVEYSDFNAAYKDYSDAKHLTSLLLPLQYQKILGSIDNVILIERSKTLTFFGKDFSGYSTDRINEEAKEIFISEESTILKDLKSKYTDLLTGLNKDLHPIRSRITKIINKEMLH